MRVPHVLLAAALTLALAGCAANPVQLASDLRFKAAESATTSELQTAKTAVIAFAGDNPGQAPTIAQLEDYGLSLTEATADFAVHFSGPDAFCVEGSSSMLGATFRATEDEPVAIGGCVEGADY